MATYSKNKKRKLRQVPRGRVYVQSTFNNTIVTVTDDTGGVLSWASAGGSGFKGARKSTPFAAQTACRNALDKAKDYGLQAVEIFVSGVGTGREQAVRAISGNNISVFGIKDVTPIAHNGCRPKKVRRV